MSILQQYTTSLDNAVNYVEFLKMLERAGQSSGPLDSQDAGPHLVNAMREQIYRRINEMSTRDR